MKNFQHYYNWIWTEILVGITPDNSIEECYRICLRYEINRVISNKMTTIKGGCRPNLRSNKSFQFHEIFYLAACREISEKF